MCSGSCFSGLECGRSSFSVAGEGTPRLTEDSAAADDCMCSFATSLSNGDSLRGGASCGGVSSNAEVRVGVSGISGSWGGELISLSVGAFEAGDGAEDASGAVERRWSRRQ